jgi:hypothetical protein
METVLEKPPLAELPNKAAMPPPIEASAAVEPPKVEPIKNGTATVGLSVTNDADRFENAVNTGDSKAFMNLAVSSPDPKVREAANEKLKVINDNAPLAKAVANIDVTTPEGRVQIAQVYQTLNNREEAKAKGWTTIQDSPQVGTALLRYVMGDKTGALTQITGGNVKASTEYDDAGKMLIVNRNELGQIDSIFDPSGKMISREEYAARGGSRELENTLYRKQQVLMQEENTKTFLKETGQQNKAAAALEVTAGISRDMADLAKDFTDLDAPTQALLAGFDKSVLNYSKNLSNTIGLLDSLSKSKTKDLSASQIKEIETGVGNAIGAVVKHQEGDKFTVDGKSGVSVSDLLQKTQQQSKSATVDRTVNQSKEELAKQIRIAQTSGAPAERITQLAKLERYFDLAGQREKIYAEHKENLPAFAQIPTTLPNITDQASRLKLNGVQGEYASAQVTAFNNWKTNELKKERAINPNFVPEPGRYEAQWVKQPEYKELETFYRDKARSILNEMPKLAKTVDVQQLTVGPITPAQANVNESKQAAKPPRDNEFKIITEEDKPDNKPKFKVRREK